MKLNPIGGGLLGTLGGGWLGFSNILVVIGWVDCGCGCGCGCAVTDISLAPLIVFETDVEIELKS